MSSNTPKKAGHAAGTHPAPADVHQNLQRLDRLANLGLFSASIAHEMKNSLVAINTFCEVLLEKQADREMAEMVRRELKRIDGLTTQMLRLAAPRPATTTSVNVHELLDLTLRLLEHQISGRMILLKRAYAASPPVVRGDESRLQHAFVNLLLNAVEAMSQGGELTVATEAVGDTLKISFRDTGIGIAPKDFEHYFVTFFTTKKNGTGLGLAICGHVVEEHRGTIEAQSEVGRGSVFMVTLPTK